MSNIRQSVGIDIAKDSFVASFATLKEGQFVEFKGTKKFDNNVKGFKELFSWSKKYEDKTTEIAFTMEATGVYYESLAFFLFEKKQKIHVLLPNRVKKFGESLDLKSKTDKIDSKIIAQMGVERRLRVWKLCSLRLRVIRTLTRERQQLVKERSIIKNQIHAENYKAEPLTTTLLRMSNRLNFISSQVKNIENELKEEVNKDDNLKLKLEKIMTIPGLSFISIITVIAETKGFVDITSMKQLSSYAGYDVSIRESGKWKGRSRISKKGNSNIRSILYMPTICTLTHNSTNKKFYERVTKNKVNGLIAITALQRKNLGLIYTLWKNNSEYIENYEALR